MKEIFFQLDRHFRGAVYLRWVGVLTLVLA
jgi:hypothetical protein